MSVLKRLSASLIVLRPTKNSSKGFEVIMVQRSKKMKFAGSSWVFPGGVYDDGDGHGEVNGFKFAENLQMLQKIAFRETFEEVGILPLSRNEVPTLDAASWKEWRSKVHDDASQWDSFLSASGIDQTTSMKPCPSFCCFLTPEFEAKRSKRQYLTHFLITSIPFREELGKETSTSPQFWFHDDVDNNENVRSLWIKPADALRRHAAGEFPMFPPQFYLLQRLCAFENVADAVDSASWFCRGTNSSSVAMVMQPEVHKSIKSGLALPFDESHQTYPGPPGARHRFINFGSKDGMQLSMNNIAALHIVGSTDKHHWRWKGSNPETLSRL